MTKTNKVRAKWTAMLAIAGAALCGVANAGPMSWTDNHNFTPDALVTTAPWTWQLFEHDIRDNGFNTATDSISGYSIKLDLYDDQDRAAEAAAVWNSGDPFSVTEFTWLGGNETLASTFLGTFLLDLTGRLQVAITSTKGDFYVGSSTLTAWGNRNSSVPEPGTLALFGAALLGFGLVRRKRAA